MSLILSPKPYQGISSSNSSPRLRNQNLRELINAVVQAQTFPQKHCSIPIPLDKPHRSTDTPDFASIYLHHLGKVSGWGKNITWGHLHYSCSLDSVLSINFFILLSTEWPAKPYVLMTILTALQRLDWVCPLAQSLLNWRLYHYPSCII